MLEELRRILIEPGGQAQNLARPGATHGGVRVKRVYLDESGPEHEIAILFRDLDRPECLFGYRVEAVETPDALKDSTGPYTDLPSAAQSWAENVWVLLEEEAFAGGYGLPRNCSPDTVAWI